MRMVDRIVAFTEIEYIDAKNNQRDLKSKSLLVFKRSVLTAGPIDVIVGYFVHSLGLRSLPSADHSGRVNHQD